MKRPSKRYFYRVFGKLILTYFVLSQLGALIITSMQHWDHWDHWARSQGAWMSQGIHYWRLGPQDPLRRWNARIWSNVGPSTSRIAGKCAGKGAKPLTLNSKRRGPLRALYRLSRSTEEMSGWRREYFYELCEVSSSVLEVQVLFFFLWSSAMLSFTFILFAVGCHWMNAFSC